jgi:hypothetical protein
MPSHTGQQSLQPTLKAARFSAHLGCAGLGAAEAVVVPFCRRMTRRVFIGWTDVRSCAGCAGALRILAMKTLTITLFAAFLAVSFSAPHASASESQVERQCSLDKNWCAFSSIPNQFAESHTLIIQHVVSGARFEHRLLSKTQQASLSDPDADADDYLKAMAVRNSLVAARGVWSSNSRYYAFSSGNLGVSADLYIFDTKSLDFEQLTDGPTQIADIRWSPWSDWIVYTGVNGFGVGAGRDDDAVWLTSPDSGKSHKLYKLLRGYMVTKLEWEDREIIAIRSNVISPYMPSYEIRIPLGAIAPIVGRPTK